MTLRARLLIAVALVALLLVGAGFAITRITRSVLVGQVDDQLTEAARSIPRLLDQEGDGRRPPPGALFRELSSFYVARVDDAGAVEVRATPDLVAADAAPPDLDAETISRIFDSERPVTISSPDDAVRYRAIGLGSNDRRGVLAVPMTAVDRTTRRLIAIQGVSTAAILGVMALVAFWVDRYGLRPIKRMTETASDIAAGDLSHRVDEIPGGSEAGALGSALNRMLGRIQSAMEEREASELRLRRFVADASHELRTPVATVRGYAELYRMGGLGDDDALAEAMRRTEQESTRMGSLVDDLLLLARLDQGRPLDRHPVDLAAVVEDVVADAKVVYPDRTISSHRLDPIGTVMGDEDRLRQVLVNLVGNALTHTAPPAEVDVRISRSGDVVAVEVEDTGPGMDAGQVAKATERFYRADPSRTRASGGSGLGLSIADAIVAAHGGTLEIDSRPGAGTKVTVSLPAAPESG